MSVRFHIIIPARLASTRLPRKPLELLGGRAMILRVMERASASGAETVHVATDSDAIAAVVAGAGGSVLMTDANHRSGTDRLVECVQALGLADEEIVVNLQGDEPLMPASCLSQVAELLHQDRSAQMATLWSPLSDAAEWRDPNVVKLVANARGHALYFSRAPIPHPRDPGLSAALAWRHVGLYAYRTRALTAWANLPASRLEQTESLEQLRALEAGWTIACARARVEVPAGIDTVEDLARVQALFAADPELVAGE